MLSIGREEIKGVKTIQGEEMTGLFKEENEVSIINKDAFCKARFEGEFPLIEELSLIGRNAFMYSKFTGEFPLLENLEEIHSSAFRGSRFSGKFPSLNNLIIIKENAFLQSRFTGEFPKMDNLGRIEKSAFGWSDLSRGEDGFVKNYPGWDGLHTWMDLSYYNQNINKYKEIKNISIVDKVNASKKQKINSLGFLRDQALNRGVSADEKYFKRYVRKLKKRGFKRDIYGNYVNEKDAAVIEIPCELRLLI